jgi:citrate-Mg2+:H+ or citrate-Ca2+:H+ symporter, CitMHS family
MTMAWLGFITIAVFLAAVLSNRVSVLVASILIPAAMAIVAGAAPQLGEMMSAGVLRVAPVGVMMMFAILYFGLMLDLGLFDPLVRGLLSFVGGDPLRLCVVSAALPMLVALDGDGATTFLISTTALLPAHRQMGVRPVVLPGILGLAAGVMNILPWGGPTARVMTVLHADAGQVFLPLLPAMLVGLLWVLIVACLFGLRERRRLGVMVAEAHGSSVGADGRHDVRPSRMFWFNAGLTIALLAALFLGLWPLPVLFMCAFAIALVANCRSWEEQRARIEAHGRSVVTVVSMVFASGVFTGVLTGTGMIDAMAKAIVEVMPAALSGALAMAVALTGMPLSLVFTPDAYYFGVLPVVAATAAAAGQDPIAIGRAALLGQMTTGFPLSPMTASTFILVGLTGVTLAEHQRFLFKWALGSTLVMTVVARLTGAI